MGDVVVQFREKLSEVVHTDNLDEINKAIEMTEMLPTALGQYGEMANIPVETGAGHGLYYRLLLEKRDSLSSRI